MALVDEFMQCFEQLPDNEKRAVAVWLALHNDFPDSFPLLNLVDDPALIGLAQFIEFFCGGRR